MRGIAMLVAAFLAVSGCSRRDMATDRVSWQTMGTVAAIQTRGVKSAREWFLPAARDVAVSVSRDVMTLFNAHDPDSELSRLAPCGEQEILSRCGGEPAAANRLYARSCYEAAFRLAAASGGAFNPRWKGEGTLDLGAIAKGFAVDEAAAEMKKLGRGENVALPDALVDMGGNVKSVRGVWRTGVMDPLGKGCAAVVELKEGEALSTSATYYRGSHIYDGRTNRPVTNDVASATVLARSAMWADALSTALFVLGCEDGRAFLDANIGQLCGDMEVSVLWIMKDGRRAVYGRNASKRFLSP